MAPATAGRVAYRATRLHGTAVTLAPGELAGWVHDRYQAGWRRLVVVDSTTGEQVGWIGRDPDTGRRTWNAVNPWPSPPPTNMEEGRHDALEEQQAQR